LKNLRILELGDTRVSDLSPLAGLVGLRRLDIRGTMAADRGPPPGLDGCEIVSSATFRRSRARAR
jgi:hypothetical protein